MSWIVAILTVILVLDCLLLILLVLIQLPKKEAGLGTAFGAGTTDALFGAGTGNALTKMTKYSTIIFFLLTLSLSLLRTHQVNAENTRFSREVSKAQADQPPLPLGPTNEAPATNLTLPAAGATNEPTAPNPAPPTPGTTNAAPAPANPSSSTPNAAPAPTNAGPSAPAAAPAPADAAPPK